MTEQKSRLVIEISSEQAKKNAEELSKELVKIFTGGEKASDSTSKLGKTIQVTSNITQNFNTTVNNTTKAVEKQTQELAKQEKQVDKTGLAFKQFASFVAGYVTIAGTISKADNYTEIQNRLKLVTKGQNELNQAMQDTFAIAQNTGSSWDGAVQVYQVFAKNAKQLGLNLKETAQLTDTVSKAVAISGASAQAAEAALVQFGQAIGSSVLRGDELNSILEQAPGLADAIAKGLGVTTSQLRTLGAAGQLTGEKVVEALQKASASVDELYGKTNKTIAASLTTLSNALTKYIGETANAGGSAKLLSDGILSISKNFELFASLGIAALMGAITAQITKQIISIGASTVAWGVNTRAIIANNTAQQAGLLVARSLSTAFLGPVGLGIAVAGVAASYLLLKKNAEDATSVLDVQKSSVQELTTQYLNLSAVQRDAEKAKLSATVKESADAYKLATSMVNNFINVLYSQGQISLESESKLKKLYDSYSKGKIGSDEFYLSVKNLNILNEEQIAKLRSLIDKNNQAKTAYDKVKSSLDAILRITPEAIKGHEEKAKAIGKEAVALQKLQDLQKSYAQKNLDTDFSLINIKSHGLEMGKALSEFYDNNKISKTRSLTNEEWAVFQKYFDKQQALKKLEDDITESKRQQTKETEKQLKVLQVNEKVKANAAKYNFDGLEGKYGLPSGMLSAIHMIESRGNANAYNKGSGAAGGFQFLKGTGDQYGVKDRYNLAQSAEGAAKYLSYLLKLFNGNVEKAVRAYHAGEGNVQKGKNLGKYNNQYIKDYYGYMGGMGGFSGSSKDYESLLNDQVKMLEKSQEEAEKIRKDFMSKGLQEEQEYKDQLKKIRENSALSGDEKKSYEAQLTNRFEAQKKLNNLQQDYELNGYKYTESQKLQYTYDTNVLRLDAEGKYSDEVKAEYKKAYKELHGLELTAYKQLQLDKLNEFKASLEQQTGELQRAYYEVMAQNTMSQPQLAMWQFQNQYSSAVGGAHDSYQNSIKDINKKDDKDQYLIDAETRSQMLIKAEQNLETQLKLIRMKGVEDEKVLRQQQYTDNISVYGTMFGQMGELVRGYAGESSGAYKTLLASQKAANLASAIMSGYTAISAAWSSAPFPANLPAVAIATTKTGVLQAAISSISGFSSGGYTGSGGKYDPAGIVHKGEVVFSQEDIARWGGVGKVEAMRKGNMIGFADGGYVTGNTESQLNSSYPALPSFNESRILDSINTTSGEASINAPVTVYVTIQNDGTSDVKSEGTSKELGLVIGNGVRKIIQQECNQGGILDREFRRRR